MKSIETRYHGPTNFRGARISATDCGDHKIYISYPHERSGEDCHRQAALALCDKLGWDGSALIGGATKAGYVFVFPPRTSSRDEDDPYPDRVMVDAAGKPHYEP